ncbi:MAG: HD domain-containing phosphohydrolase [Candidatus Muiribacteriota bacterium]
MINKMGEKKEIKKLIEENKKLKKECELLKQDNELLQKDYYNQIIINEFIKLDEFIDNIEDLLYNLFKTLEDIIEVDYIALSLFENKYIYFAHYCREKRMNFSQIEKNFLNILKENKKKTRHFVRKDFYIDSIGREGEFEEEKESVFSNIVHKISRHGKSHGLICFYMSKSTNILQKSNLIKLFMPHVSTLIENAIMFQKHIATADELRKKLSAFSTLYDLSRVQPAGKKLKTLLKKILKAMVNEFYGKGGSILFIDDEKDELYVKAYIGLQNKLAKKFKMKIGNGIVGKIAHDGKPLIIIDQKFKKAVKKIKGVNTFFWDFKKEYDDIRKNVISAISAPVKFNKEILGVVSITSDNHIYNEEDLKLLEVFCSNIAYVTKNQLLYKDLSGRIDELEIVNQLMKQVNVNTDLNDIINKVFGIITETFDFKTACIILDRGNSLHVNYYSEYNINSNNVEKIEKEILQDVQELLPNKLYAYDIFRKIVKKGNKRFTHNKKFDFMSVPIVIKKKIHGFLSIIQSKGKKTDYNIRFLSTIASAFSIALENNLVYDRIEKKVSSLSTIFEVTKNIAEKLDYNQVSSELTETAARILNSKLVVLRIFNEEESQLEIDKIEWNGSDESVMLKAEVLDSIELSFSREAFMKHKPVYTGKLIEKHGVRNIQWLIRNELNTLFSVPLIIRGKAVGVLNCYMKEDIGYNAEELEIIQNLCAQAAIALENSRLFSNLEKTYFDTIAALAAAIDAKDHYTHGHSEQVMEYSIAIAEDMNLSEETITAIKFAGLLHDIGKIGVDDNILKKPGRLSSEERTEIEKHPVYGTLIVEKINFLKSVSSLTYHHHERWDGKGYPSGLKGDDIPIGSRILSVADTYDAMTSNRSYRKALPDEVAIEEIKRCSGSQFDPKVVKAFLNVAGRKIRIKKMKILRHEKINKLRKTKPGG